MKKITITELAKTAGVSTSSVSRFLKNENVSMDVETKIKDAIEKTGYVVEESEPIEELMKDKMDVREEFTMKFKGAVKKTGEMMQDTKSKLVKSGETIKKNVAKADIPGKVKGSLDKSGSKLTQVKDKVIMSKVSNSTSKEKVQPTLNDIKPIKVAPVRKKPVVREKKGYTFGVLTKDATNPRSRKMIKAIQSICHESDCLLCICVGEGNAPLEEKYMDTLIQQKVNAVIVESCANPTGLSKQLKDADITAVYLNQQGAGFISLAVDEEQAGEALGNYLMKMRHLIVRYLGADEVLSSAHYEGIKKVYHEKKQPLDFATKMCDGSYFDIYEKLKEIFEEKIDVLLLERDEMAIPLNKYLKEYHIAVPQNTSVMSFGGHAITQVMSPTLSSLAFDYHTHAEYVCATLFRLLEGKTKLKMPEIYQIQEGDSVR